MQKRDKRQKDKTWGLCGMALTAYIHSVNPLTVTSLLCDEAHDTVNPSGVNIDATGLELDLDGIYTKII